MNKLFEMAIRRRFSLCFLFVLIFLCSNNEARSEESSSVVNFYSDKNNVTVNVYNSSSSSSIVDWNEDIGFINTPYWYGDRETTAAILWEPYIVTLVYNKCFKSEATIKSPIPESLLLGLSHHMGDDKILRKISIDTSNYFKLKTGQLAGYIKNNIYLDFIRKAVIACVVLFCCFAVLIGFYCSLFTCHNGCKSVIERFWCGYCCGVRVRQPLHEYPQRIRLLLYVVSILCVMGAVVCITSTAIYGANAYLEMQNVVCQAYRWPYTISFGSSVNQKQYLLNSGRDDVPVPVRWEGLLHTRQALNALQNTLKNPHAEVVDKVEAFARDMRRILKMETTNLNILSRSLYKTEGNFAALQELHNHDHQCYLCKAVATGGSLYHLIHKRYQEVHSLRSQLREFPEKLTREVDSATLKRASSIMDGVIVEVNRTVSFIKSVYRFLNDFKEPWSRLSNAVYYSTIVVCSTAGLLVLIYAVVVVRVGVEVRCGGVVGLSPWMTHWFSFSWCCLLLLAVVVLFISFVLLSVAGTVAFPCLMSENLIYRNKYRDYPLLVENLGYALNANHDATRTLKVLDSLGWLHGDGSFDHVVNVTHSKSLANQVVKSVSAVLNDYDGVLDHFLKSVKLEDLSGELSSRSWPVVVDFSKLDNAKIKGIPKEVLFSGLQPHAEKLHEGVLDEMLGKLHPFKEVPSQLYGLIDAEKKINELLRGLIKNEQAALCFGFVDGCSSNTGRDVCIVYEGFDVDADACLRRLTKKVDSDTADNLAALKRSIKFMVRKLVLLVPPREEEVLCLCVDCPCDHRLWPFEYFNATTFKRVPYNEFVSSDAESTNPWLNQAISTVGVSFDAAVKNRIDEFKRDLENAVKPMVHMYDEIEKALQVQRPLIAELLAVRDPICRGVVSSAGIVGISLGVLGIVLVIMAVVAYKLWHHTKDMMLQAESVEEKRRKLNLNLVAEQLSPSNGPPQTSGDTVVVVKDSWRY